MSHARTQIRKAVAAALANAQSVPATVYASRVHKLEPADVPYALVYTTEEASDRYSMDADLWREVTVRVVLVVRALDSFDDDADALAAAVESVLASDAVLAALVKSLVLRSTEIEYAGSQDVPVGTLTLEFNAAYATAASNPETLLP